MTDRSVEADARRFRWIVANGGEFSVWCYGLQTYLSTDADKARDEIDEDMATDGEGEGMSEEKKLQDAAKISDAVHGQVKRMDIKEFWEAGFLQEANRQFFHPLGLALKILIHGDGEVVLGGVWDYRDDPEGVFFGPKDLSAEKAATVSALRESKRVVRTKEVGAIVQPIKPSRPKPSGTDAY